LLALSALQQLPTSAIRAQAEQLLARLVPLFLRNHNNGNLHQVLVEFAQLWHRIFALDPWHVSVVTINAMLAPESTSGGLMYASLPNHPACDSSLTHKCHVSRITHAELIDDPLVVLSVDERVFAVPPLVTILLKVTIAGAREYA